MSRTKKLVALILVVSIFMIAIGYAAISNVTLNINGTAQAETSQANFTVKFTGETETDKVSVKYPDLATIRATVIDDTNAKIEASGLTAKGDTVTATYTVQNTSADLSADLSVETTTNSNKEYFAIEPRLAKTSLIAGEKTTLTVTVELLKTPIEDTVSSTIKVQLTANPVQPGDEGNSGGGSGSGGSGGGSTGDGGTTENVTSAGTYLPTGFSEVAGTSLATGLTIQDSKGNQYVWVEVPQTEEVYQTAGLSITAFTDAEYTLIENDLHKYTSVYRNGTSYTDTHSGNDASTGLTSTQYTELKKKMLKSVYQNGGFYVGKYEAGITDSYRDYGEEYDTEHPIVETAVVQENAYPYNWVTCSQAQTLASNMASGEYTSSLMFGVQWDLMLKYLETKGAATVEELNGDSTSWGNVVNNTYTIENSNVKYNVVDQNTFLITEWLPATSYTHNEGDITILTTGASSDFSKQNIYNIAGNIAEWTLEYTSDSSHPCALRGGDCISYGYDYSASYRINYDATASDPSVGFRPSLF